MKAMVEISQRYISKPFREYSCIGFVHSFYADLGIKLPTEFEGLTIKNYMDAFKNDPYQTQLALLKVVRSLGQPSSATRPHLYDLLVVSQNTTRAGVIKPGFFPAIYTRKGQALTSFLRYGVTLLNLNENNRPIVARRVV